MRAVKGRLYGGGLDAVARIGGQCRAVWNLFLAESIARYRSEQKFVFYIVGADTGQSATRS
ncbi:MAG: helix-turn-helix domain-containing protein [Terracidiphilus sp.]